jgi:O-acetyl-ADP-ribose deacetylase (regulator of RNase III)
MVADITTLTVDGIVNAANETLLGGGGVDGAIHRAAGPKLLEACRAFNGCAVGEVVVTAGFALPARHVFHTVGPRWKGGFQDEPRLLSCCYGRSIEVAESLGLRTLAFPAISTGVFRFPKPLAARIAVESVLGACSEPSSLDTVIFACFSETDLELYLETLDAVLQTDLRR